MRLKSLKRRIPIQATQEGNFSEYLNRYLELENADAEKFIGILDSFIQEEPMMKVFSVDGKK